MGEDDETRRFFSVVRAPRWPSPLEGETQAAFGRRSFDRTPMLRIGYARRAKRSFVIAIAVG